MIRFSVFFSAFLILGSSAYAHLNGCQISEDSSKRYYQVVSKDNQGVLRSVYWAKYPDPFGGVYSNLGDGDSGNRIFPVLKDGTVVKDGRRLNKDELAPSSRTATGDEPSGTKFNSDAVYACESRGLHLPMQEEFEALKNCFEKDTEWSDDLANANLSEQGSRDLQALFTHKTTESVANSRYWTSTIRGDGSWPDSYYSSELRGEDGRLGADFRILKQSVICVHR